MTLRTILTTIALVAVTTFRFSGPLEAQSTQDQGPELDAYSDCVQECLEQFIDNVKDCKKAAKVCDFSILWTCFASHTSTEILDKCLDTADDALSACLATCGPRP